MRGKMRLEKGKMTRKLEDHCFFRMSFLGCHFPPLFKSLSGSKMLVHWILLEIPFRLSNLLGESNWLHLLRAAWMLELGWPSAGIQVRGWTPAVQPRPRLSASSPLIHFLSARFVHRKMPWQLQTWAMSKSDRMGPKRWYRSWWRSWTAGRSRPGKDQHGSPA